MGELALRHSEPELRGRSSELLAAAWRGPLSLMERVALSVSAVSNEWAPLGRLAAFWRHEVVARLVDRICGSRLRVVGVENLQALAPEHGVLVAANHRSFFDLFVVTRCLREHTSFCRSLYFPVRSGFWYDNPLGLIVNAAGTGMSMFPPVFRPPQKRAITRSGLDLLAARLAAPGTVVGMHPEGTRSKSDDPYELLPAERSFGRLALLAKATVIPAFVSGLSNSLAKEISARRRADAEVIVVFGKAVNLGDLYDLDPERLRHQIAAGERVLAAIRDLSALEKVERSTRAHAT